MTAVVFKRIQTFIIFIVSCNYSLAQLPVVVQKFDKLFLSENFDSSNTYWSTVSNTDNLLIVQEGEYIMHRKASVSPFAVMANFADDLSVFRLVTSLKLDKTSAVDGSIGIIFMAQPEGKGGFIFELNKNSYRLRQINGGSYKYLSGNAKNGGWAESEIVKALSLPNLIEIRSADKNYDLFLNNMFLLSFSESAYSTGSFGFIIGPASKGKADFLYLFTTSNDKNNSSAESESKIDNKKSSMPEADVMALVESIISLKTQINKLSEDNEDLKQIIQALRDGEKENEKQKNNFERQIKEADALLKQSSSQYDSLMKANLELKRYKEMVQGNDNGDLVINLSKNLKKEKGITEELLKSNKQLSDSLVFIKNELKAAKVKSQVAIKEVVVPISQTKTDSIPEKKSEKREFVLPKEN